MSAGELQLARAPRPPARSGGWACLAHRDPNDAQSAVVADWRGCLRVTPLGEGGDPPAGGGPAAGHFQLELRDADGEPKPLARPMVGLGLVPQKPGEVVFAIEGMRNPLYAKLPEDRPGAPPATVFRLGGAAVCHSGAVSCLAVSADGFNVATGGHEGTVVVWQLVDGSVGAMVPKAHLRGVASIAFAASNVLVTGGKEGDIRVWEMFGNRLRVVHSLCSPGGAPVTCVAIFSTAKPQPVDSTAPASVLEAVRDARALDPASSRNFLAAGTSDGTTVLWTASHVTQDRWRQVAVVQQARGAHVTHLAFRADGCTLAVGMGAGPGGESVQVYDTAFGRSVGKVPLRGPVVGCEYTDDAAGANASEELFICDDMGGPVLFGGETLVQSSTSFAAAPVGGRTQKGGAPAPVEAIELEPEIPREPLFVNPVLDETKALLSQVTRTLAPDAGAEGNWPWDRSEPEPEAPEEPRVIVDVPPPAAQAPGRRRWDEAGAPAPLAPQPRAPGAYLRAQIAAAEAEASGRGLRVVGAKALPAGGFLKAPGPLIIPPVMNASSPQYPKSPGSTRTPRLDPKSDRRARLPAGNPAKHPALFSSRKLQEKVLEIESETFEGSQAAAMVDQLLAVDEGLVGKVAAMGAEFSREAKKYSALPTVQGRAQSAVPRKVPKQVDPRWVASLENKPRMEDLWRLEDRLPHQCNTSLFEVPEALSSAMMAFIPIP